MERSSCGTVNSWRMRAPGGRCDGTTVKVRVARSRLPRNLHRHDAVREDVGISRPAIRDLAGSQATHDRLAGAHGAEPKAAGHRKRCVRVVCASFVVRAPAKCGACRFDAARDLTSGTYGGEAPALRDGNWLRAAKVGRATLRQRRRRT